MKHQPSTCPDCDLTRREFVQRVGTTALAVGAASWVVPLPRAFAAPTKSSTAETAVQKLFETLTATQRGEMCFPFDHPSRTKINANWHVSKPTIEGDFYTPEQQQLIAKVFRNLTSADGHERFLKQTEEDQGGIGTYSIAVFGEPHSNQFEWILTGRHLTIRADGDTVAGAAFGEPIVYGHGEESDPKDNLFHYQRLQANAVFKALDAKQSQQALLEKAPVENEVPLQGKQGNFPGIAVAELSSDQKGLVRSVIKSLFAPYREEDIEEAMSILDQGGGMDSLHMAFYKQDDLKNDGEWDIWRIEGATLVSHFRGAPHVHAYLNVGTRPNT